MCDNLKNIKRSIKKEFLQKELLRRVELVNTLGVSADEYHIIDRRPMTFELIKDLKLALEPNSPSIKSVIPSSEKIRIRVGRNNLPLNYEIRYSYDIRDGISGPKLLGTSRDFCVHLIDANQIGRAHV